MNGFDPVGGRQSFRVLSALFEVVNQIQKHIHRSVLSRRPMLVHDGVNGDGGVNARQLVADLIGGKGLHDRDGAVLPIIGIPAPPDHAEDLAGPEVIHVVPLALFVVIRRGAEAQSIEPGAGNVTSDKTGQAGWTQTAPLFSLQLDDANITLTNCRESSEKCLF